MLCGQKMKKSKNGLFLPTWKLFNFNGFQAHVHGKLQEKKPDRFKVIIPFNFRWFQSKGLKPVKAHRNNSRNIVTGGKRRYFASKLWLHPKIVIDCRTVTNTLPYTADDALWKWKVAYLKRKKKHYEYTRKLSLRVWYDYVNIYILYQGLNCPYEAFITLELIKAI